MSRSSHGKPTSAPAGFILPCRPTVAARPPRGPGWVHELKHDGYRLQIHVRDGRVRLYTMNGNDWTRRYPRADFDALHSRTADENAVALAFDLLFAGDDIRRRPLIERKKELKGVLRNARDGGQYVEYADGDGAFHGVLPVRLSKSTAYANGNGEKRPEFRYRRTAKRGRARAFPRRWGGCCRIGSED